MNGPQTRLAMILLVVVALALLVTRVVLDSTGAMGGQPVDTTEVGVITVIVGTLVWYIHKNSGG